MVAFWKPSRHIPACLQVFSLAAWWTLSQKSGQPIENNESYSVCGQGCFSKYQALSKAKFYKPSEGLLLIIIYKANTTINHLNTGVTVPSTTHSTTFLMNDTVLQIYIGKGEVVVLVVNKKVSTVDWKHRKRNQLEQYVDVVISVLTKVYGHDKLLRSPLNHTTPPLPLHLNLPYEEGGKLCVYICMQFSLAYNLVRPKTMTVPSF